MNTRDMFIKAVFNIDLEGFRHLLETETFDESLLEDIHFGNGTPCPIYWLTQCWEIVFANPEEWGTIKDVIAENKRKNLEIKRIFEERFGVEFSPIDFYNTDFGFFRNDRSDSFEDIFDYTREQMIAKGCRGIDLDLYVAVCKFDFDKVEKLLKLGANPVFDIPGEDTYCMERIGTECSYLETTTSLSLVIEGEREVTPLWEDFSDLLGLGAHERMYDILSMYDPRKDN